MTGAATQSQTRITVKPSQMVLAARTCIRAGRSPMLHSDPGMGKSSIVMQVADQLFAALYGYKITGDGKVFDPQGNPIGNNPNLRPWFRDIRTALLDAVDLRGVPHVKARLTSGLTKKQAADAQELYETLWAIPGFLPQDPRGGIVFFDEINRGGELVQNGCLSIALTGTLGEYTLPAGWVCAAAVNDNDPGTRKMSGALTRRFVHFDLRVDLEDISRYAVDNGWDPAIIAYMRFAPQNLNIFDAKDRVSPNPRAWEFVSQLISAGIATDGLNVKDALELEHAMFAGVIGEKYAVEISAFIRMYRELPSLDQIILDPKGAKLPDKPSVQYAVAAGLSRRMTVTNIGKIIVYLNRLPAEYAFMSLTAAMRRDEALRSTPQFVAWVTAHPEFTR